MKKNLKFEIIKKINLLTFFFFLYTAMSVYIPVSVFLQKNNNIQIDYSLRTVNQKHNLQDSNSVGIILEEKVNRDLLFHNIQCLNTRKIMTQLSVNKEGKITGYKPFDLRSVNYLLETPVKNLVKKDNEITNQYINIYWLNLKSQ